jgi:glycosyltransferase involved in cell wall biosynthesis
MDVPELAIIVATYQMPGPLRRALESISCQRTARRFEVIVADDGSGDETPRVVSDFARSVPFPVRFATHPHRGFHPARSRNDGVRYSTASHLLFFDGDCVLPPNHIEAHLSAWRPGTVVCGAPVRLEEETSRGVTLETIRHGELTPLAPPPELRKLAAIHRKFWWYNLIGHATKPALKSTDFSVSRSDYERLNGFDEQFRGWGCEDDDFGRRAKAAGLRLVSVLDRTRVYHLWHPPAPSKPSCWKAGANVAYFQRSLRLTRCLKGLVPRRFPRDLTVQVPGPAQRSAALDRLLARHGWQIELDPGAKADLELMTISSAVPVRARTVRWSGRGDVRVLALVDDCQRLPPWARKAQIVLSSQGDVGFSHQCRLRLDDPAGVWQLLAGRPQHFEPAERATEIPGQLSRFPSLSRTA